MASLAVLRTRRYELEGRATGGGDIDMRLRPEKSDSSDSEVGGDEERADVTVREESSEEVELWRARCQVACSLSAPVGVLIKKNELGPEI